MTKRNEYDRLFHSSEQPSEQPAPAVGPDQRVHPRYTAGSIKGGGDIMDADTTVMEKQNVTNEIAEEVSTNPHVQAPAPRDVVPRATGLWANVASSNSATPQELLARVANNDEPAADTESQAKSVDDNQTETNTESKTDDEPAKREPVAWRPVTADAPKPAPALVSQVDKIVEPADSAEQDDGEEILSLTTLDKALGTTLADWLNDNQDLYEQIEAAPHKVAFLKNLAKGNNGTRVESNEVLTNAAKKWLQTLPKTAETQDKPADAEITIAGSEAKAFAMATNIKAYFANRREKNERKDAQKKADAIAELDAEMRNGEYTQKEYDKRKKDINKEKLNKKVVAAVALVAVAAVGLYANKLGLTHFGGGKSHGLNIGPLHLGPADPTQAAPAGPGSRGDGGNGVPANPTEGQQAPKAPEQISLPDGTKIDKTPEGIKHFFESAIDPASYNDKGHVNDFNRPIPNGSNPLEFKLALAQQLRGNSHELASYLSVAKIPGAPLEADFPNNQAGYIQAINDYAIKLDKNPSEHLQQYTLLADKINGAEFNVRDVTFNYESTLIDQNGQFGIDTFVPANGTVTEVTFNKGTPDEFSILVRNECGQTIKELVEQHFAAPKNVAPVAQTQYAPQPISRPVTHPAPQPIPRSTPIQTPTGHGGGGGGGTPPPATELAPKLESDSPLNKDGLTEQLKGAAGPARPEVRPSLQAGPGGYVDNGATGTSGASGNNETAPGASAPTPGSRDNLPAAQSGSNGSAGASSGTESSAGSTGAGSDAGNGGGTTNGRSSEAN